MYAKVIYFKTYSRVYENNDNKYYCDDAEITKEQFENDFEEALRSCSLTNVTYEREDGSTY